MLRVDQTQSFREHVFICAACERWRSCGHVLLLGFVEILIIPISDSLLVKSDVFLLI